MGSRTFVVARPYGCSSLRFGSRVGEFATGTPADAAYLKKECPEQYDAVVECAAFVNWRRAEAGDEPVLALSFQV